MELYNIDARDIDHVLINEEEIAVCVDAIA